MRQTIIILFLFCSYVVNGTSVAMGETVYVVRNIHKDGQPSTYSLVPSPQVDLTQSVLTITAESGYSVTLQNLSTGESFEYLSAGDVYVIDLANYPSGAYAIELSMNNVTYSGTFELNDH